VVTAGHANHVCEDKPIEKDEGQRLKNRPGETENGTGKTGRKIALDEFAKEVEVDVGVEVRLDRNRQTP